MPGSNTWLSEAGPGLNSCLTDWASSVRDKEWHQLPRTDHLALEKAYLSKGRGLGKFAHQGQERVSQQTWNGNNAWTLTDAFKGLE